jgi:hypothetical protein
MKLKKAIKCLYLLYKSLGEDVEIFVKVNDDKLIGVLHLPIHTADIKKEKIDDEDVVVIDLCSR